MSDTVVILNPSAHSEKAKRAIETIQRLAHRCTVRFTSGLGDARQLAADAARDGARIVVAAGGDGTVNEVANGLANTPAALGVLPIGTMNVFSKELGLPAKLASAWRAIERGFIQEIDLPLANDQHFVQLAGIGLDAQVVKETSWKSKKAFGPLSYLFSAAQIAIRPAPRLRVECDGETHEGSFVLIGNGRYYGAKIVLFPQASLTDGQFDVLIFKHLKFPDIARYLGGVLLGRHTELADVKYLQTSDATISCDEETPVEVDGELFGATPVRVRMQDKLRVVILEESKKVV